MQDGGSREGDGPVEEAAPSLPMRAGRLVLQLLLTAMVTWFIFRALGMSLQELRAVDYSDWELRGGPLILATLVLVAAYLYSAGLWGVMVRELGGPGIGILASQRIFFTANLGRYVPGKVWQIAGLAYLARRRGVRAGTATAAAVLGQGFSLAGATLVGLGVFLESGRNPGGEGGWLVLFLVILVGAMILPTTHKGLLRLWFRLGRRDAPGGFRPDEAFGVRWMGLYAVAWILQGLAFWLLARGLGLEITALAGAPTYPAAYVLGYLAVFAPAGVGVREVTLLFFLEPVLGAGAAVLALVARLWTTVVELLLAVILAGGYLRKGEQGGNAGA